MVSNSDSSIAYFSDTQAVYTVTKSKPSSTKKSKSHPSDNKIAFWGDSNTFPNIVTKELERNADLLSAIDWKARALYAGGIRYKVQDMDSQGNPVYDDEGNEILKRKFIPEIEDFLDRNWQYPISASTDFYKFYNVFPEFVLSKSREKIVRLTAPFAGECRFSLQDENGMINNCFMNANWDEGVGADDENTIQVPVIDTLFNDIESIREQEDNYKFILPLSYPTGKKYYQLAHWNVLRVSGWLDLADEIPKFKKALMKNQMTVKYHIQMPDYWMEWKYPDFKTRKPAEQKSLQEDEMKMFNDFLSGAENAGKTIVTQFKTDPHTLKEFPGWRVIPIDDKLKDGAYLEDSAEATIKIYSALAIDPSLAGIIPGTGGSNRSGSDKREALNIYFSLIQPHADIILRPYKEISRFNGWNKKYGRIHWEFKQPMLQTLDKIPPSRRETKLPE